MRNDKGTQKATAIAEKALAGWQHSTVARFRIIGSERIKYVLKIKSDRLPVKTQFYNLDAIAILDS